MKKNINIIIFLILFLIISVPLFGIRGSGGEKSESENRVLASKPSLFLEDSKLNPNLKSEFNAWLNDNIGFRNEMIQLNTDINYKIFDKVSNNDVLVGKENWLFYQGEGKVSISNYQAINHYSENELQTILKNVMELKEWCESNGMEFVLMLIPNKEYIYSEYLPEGIIEVNKKKNIDLVVEYIRSHSDVNVVYPKDALIEGKKTHSVYYKYDTHWNPYGAYIGYSELLKSIGMEPITFNNFKSKKVLNNEGDLSNMAVLNDKLIPYEEFKIKDSSKCIFDDKQGNLSYQKYTSDDLNGKSIFFMGDSFRMAIKPYLNQSFKYTNYVHRERKDFEEAIQENTDVFVYEIVERYVNTLLYSNLYE